MAARKPLFMGTEPYAEEMAVSDEMTLGALTIGAAGNITLSGGGEVSGLPATPSSTCAASKEYVHAVAAGLAPKPSVKARAQGDITIAAPGATIDGVSMGAGDRFLAAVQTTPTEDGIYVWTAAATPATRAVDLPAAAEARGVYVWVEEGTDADTGWVCSDDDGSDVVGTDDLTFVQFTGLGLVTAGDGLTKTGNTMAVNVEAANPSLAIVSDEVGIKFNGSGGLEKLAAGTGIKLSGTTLALAAGGASVKGLPSLFEINGSAVSANVTKANLDELTGAGATALHTHAGVPATEAPKVEGPLTTATDVIAVGDPVYANANDTVGKSLANDDAKARVLGVNRVGAGAAPIACEVVSAGPCVGVLVGATFNTPYYLADAGGLATALPAAGSRVIQLGYALNATDLFVKIEDFGKKAA